MSSLTEQATALLNLIPETGAIGNVTLRKNLYATFDFSEGTINPTYEGLKEELLAAGLIKLGRGKGGSVRRLHFSSPGSESVEIGEAFAANAAISDSSVTEQAKDELRAALPLVEKLKDLPGMPKINEEEFARMKKELSAEISYPTGSLGEHVPDATGDSNEHGESF